MVVSVRTVKCFLALYCAADHTIYKVSLRAEEKYDNRSNQGKRRRHHDSHVGAVGAVHSKESQCSGKVFRTLQESRGNQVFIPGLQPYQDCYGNESGGYHRAHDVPDNLSRPRPVDARGFLQFPRHIEKIRPHKEYG